MYFSKFKKHKIIVKVYTNLKIVFINKTVFLKLKILYQDKMFSKKKFWLKEL